MLQKLFKNGTYTPLVDNTLSVGDRPY